MATGTHHVENCIQSHHVHACRKATLQQKKQWDLSNLQFIMSGAEPIRVQSMDAFFGAFKQCGLDPLVFCSAYGLAEHVCGTQSALRTAAGY